MTMHYEDDRGHGLGHLNDDTDPYDYQSSTTTGGKRMTTEKKEEAWGEGYCPHAFMERFKCPRCGGVHFKSYPQAVPADRSETWTWEYVCAKCGQGMGLTVLGSE